MRSSAEHLSASASKAEASLQTSARSLAGNLKRRISIHYLAGSAEIVRRRIAGRSGPRKFDRVIIVGPLARQNGVASGARLQHAALQQLGVDTDLVDATPGLRNPLFHAAHRSGTAYIVHAGGPQAPTLLATVLPQAANAYRIAYWAWELPDPPKDWEGCERHFDEVWTPSKFAKRSLAGLFDCPIYVVPHHVAAGSMRVRNPTQPFTVLAMADTRSSMSRKNPEGALLAFRAAFGESQTTRLVLKLNGRPAELNDFVQCFSHLLRVGNVEVIQDYLDNRAMAELYRRTDVFLSLHRSEGFGLPMLETMANGVPIVATAWSGNMEFMTAQESELVPYRLVPVEDRSRIYSGSLWAEPDIQTAARALRRLADDQHHYHRLAAAAYQRVSTASPRFPFVVPSMDCTHTVFPMS